MSEVSRVQEPEPVRARVDRRDELAYKIQRAVEGSPDTIRYDEDDWTRIADVVMDMFDELQRGASREVIEQAERRVLTESADFIERHVSQVGPASQALAPGQSFAVKLLRDRAALRGGLADRTLVPAPDLVELPKFQGCTDSDPDRCACAEPALVCEACQEEIVEGMQAYVITVKDAPWLADDDSDQSWSNVWWHATCDQRPQVGGGDDA